MAHWLRLRLWFGRHLLAILGGCFAAAVLFVLLTPLLLEWVSNIEGNNSADRRFWFEWLERVHHVLLQTMVAAWVFALGSSIASFLNVVAFRVPRGESILGRSHCPRCQKQLSMWENMPVFGWLRHGGRCATCRIPISPRYLFVELLLGSGFLIVFVSNPSSIYRLGANSLVAADAISQITIGLTDFLLSASVLAAIFLGALLQWERARIPWSVVAAVWLIAITVLLGQSVVEWVLTSAWTTSAEGALDLDIATTRTVGQRAAALLTALVIGAILPLQAEPQGAEQTGIQTREMLIFLLVGLCLPWRTTVVVSIVSAALLLLTKVWPTAQRIPLGWVYLGMILGVALPALTQFSAAAKSTASLQFMDVGLTGLALVLSIATRMFSATHSRA